MSCLISSSRSNGEINKYFPLYPGNKEVEMVKSNFSSKFSFPRSAIRKKTISLMKGKCFRKRISSIRVEAKPLGEMPAISTAMTFGLRSRELAKCSTI